MKNNFSKNISKMSVSERIEIAERKTKALTFHLDEVLRIHENNSFVVYSRTIAGQIKRSIAAHAFATLQQSMIQYEIVAICRLWDSADFNKENIFTIAKMIDHKAVHKELFARTKAQWSSPGDDEFAVSRAKSLATKLQQALCDIGRIEKSPLLASVMNMRDKHFAHLLEETRREKRGPVLPLKYGDERNLLDQTISIVESLYLGINNTSISFAASRNIWRRHSKALWEGVTVSVIE